MNILIRKVLTKLIRPIQYVLNKLITPISSVNLDDRKGAIHKAWGHIFSNHIEGDYVEFGVYKGDSLIIAYNEYQVFKNWMQGELLSPEDWRRVVARNFINKNANFHGLDTFEGMPANNEKNITFSKGNFFATINEVTLKLKKAGVKDFFLYKGLFSESTLELNNNISKYVAIVNIDGDLYESALDSLNIIEPKLQIGTVLLFDDYNAFNSDNTKGERRASIEFFKKSNFIFEKWFNYHYSGQSFLCVGEK